MPRIGVGVARRVWVACSGPEKGARVWRAPGNGKCRTGMCVKNEVPPGVFAMNRVSRKRSKEFTELREEFCWKECENVTGENGDLTRIIGVCRTRGLTSLEF